MIYRKLKELFGKSPEYDNSDLLLGEKLCSVFKLDAAKVTEIKIIVSVAEKPRLYVEQYITSKQAEQLRKVLRAYEIREVK